MELEISIKQESLVYDDVTTEWNVKDEIKVEEEVFHKGTNTFNKVLTNYDQLIAEIPRLCSICDKIFPNSLTFLQHNITHLKIPLEKLNIPKELPLKILNQCSYCGIKIKSLHNFKRHNQNKHTNIRLVNCKYCNEMFKKWYLKTHIRKVHAPNKLQCNLCLKMFKSTAAMEKHKLYIHDKIYMHTKSNADMGFRCDLCKLSFKSKKDLLAHVKYYDCNTNKIQCDKCEAILKNKQILRNHYRWVHHDDGKVYTCNICDKKFKTPYHLQTHSKNAHKSIN